jgi:hypothetical protein
MLNASSSEKSKDVSMLIDGVIAAAVANAFSEALDSRIRRLPLDINEVLEQKFTIKPEITEDAAAEVPEE